MVIDERGAAYLSGLNRMRRPAYHREGRERIDVKMTPMIDVIFLLLIFFVCTASFQAAEEVLPTNLSLPGTVSSDVPIDEEWEDLDEIVVKILWREGKARWQINQRDYRYLMERDLPAGGNATSVEAVLRGAARVKIDLPVILDVEGDVPLDDVINAYDLCRQIGLERIRFAARVKDLEG